MQYMCVRAQCLCVRENAGIVGGGGEVETGYVGNNTKHKKCHMIWNTGLIYLASEGICCMWFGGENVFLLCSQCAQTQHMETFSERPWVCEKKESFRHFISLPLFIAFWVLFFSNWLNYIHLLATCRNFSLINIRDPLWGSDVQLADMLILYCGVYPLLHWFPKWWALPWLHASVTGTYQWTMYLQPIFQSVINTLPLTWDSCMSALLSAINMLEGLVKYW